MELSGGDDQSISLTPTDLQFLGEVDPIIERAQQAGNVEILMEWGLDVIKGQQLQGLALAKVLANAKPIYDLKPVTDRASGKLYDFDQYAAEYWGRSIQTVRKYRKVWEYVLQNDKVVSNRSQFRRLASMPIKNLLLLTPAAEAGQLDGDGEQVASLGTSFEIRDYIREKRGEQTSSATAVHISVERSGDTAGRLMAHHKGQDYVIGYLYVTSDLEVVRQAVERLLANSHVLDRN